MAKGRKTGGRQPGTRNKTNEHRALAIKVAGITPKEFLLNGMAFYRSIIVAEAAKGDAADTAKIAEAFARGAEFAKDVAPYCHARLASITHSGQINSDVEVRDARDRLAHLFAREGVAAGATNGASGSTH